MRRTVIALLLVTGAAAAVAQPAKQNPSAQSPQTGHCAVGVVSHLGEKFRVEESGFPEMKVSEVPVESWHLDDLVVDRIRGALGKRTGVQRIPYHKEAFASDETSRLMQLLGNYDPALKAKEGVRTLASGMRCARYVLVTPGIKVFSDYDAPRGIAIVKGLGLVGMHAVIKAWVFDGETFKVLEERVGYTTRSSFGGIFGTAHPERLLDASFWPDPPNSAGQNLKLCEAARELITRDLDAMLPELLPTL